MFSREQWGKKAVSQAWFEGGLEEHLRWRDDVVIKWVGPRQHGMVEYRYLRPNQNYVLFALKNWGNKIILQRKKIILGKTKCSDLKMQYHKISGVY